MASPIYLAKLKLPLTEKPATLYSPENQLTYLDVFNIQNTIKIIAANFTEEAPADDKQYARKNQGWSEIDHSSSGIPEAPIDGKIYGRKNASWTEVISGSGAKPRLVASAYVADTTGTSHVIKVPELTRAGDLLIITGYARSVVTPPIGWTLHTSSSITAVGVTQIQFVLTKIAAALDAGSVVTVRQATSGRLGLTVLAIANAAILVTTHNNATGPGPTVAVPSIGTASFYILAASVINQTSPGTLSASGLIQLTPSEGNDLRNLTAVRYVDTDATLTVPINGGTATNFLWINIFIGAST